MTAKIDVSFIVNGEPQAVSVEPRRTLADYLVPTMAEIPTLEIRHLETVTEASVTGAKGVGEGGTIGAPAAVLNAVSDALAPFGIGICEMPITPQRIRQLLRECRRAAQ